LTDRLLRCQAQIINGVIRQTDARPHARHDRAQQLHDAGIGGDGDGHEPSDAVHGAAYTSPLKEAPIDLTVEIGSKGPWTIVSVAGEIDLFTAPKLREQFLAALDDGTTTDRLLVDLTRVSFMDSTGLGVLIGALRRMNERDGRMALVCSEGPVLRVLELTRLNEVFSIFPSVDDAASGA
jgi:anti-sigma B factor antagonist